MNRSQRPRPAGPRLRRSSHRQAGAVALVHLSLAVVTAVLPTLMRVRVAGHLSLGLLLVALQVAVAVTMVARWRPHPGRPSVAEESRTHDHGAWA